MTDFLLPLGPLRSLLSYGPAVCGTVSARPFFVFEHGYEEEEEEELNDLDDDRATEPGAKRQKIDVCAHHGGRLRYTLSRMLRKLVGRPVYPTFSMLRCLLQLLSMLIET